MTPNAYINSILSKYRLPSDHRRQVTLATNDLRPHISRWAGQRLLSMKRSGSFAKGTTVRGGTDLDLFVSLRSGGNNSLAQIYESLYSALQHAQLAPRRQNVSIGLTVRGLQVDVVPARKHAGLTTNHSLYKQRTKTWTQTNIDRHIRVVKQSGLQTEMRALKLWRRLHGLEFPSFLLELVAIEAMRRQRRRGIATNLLTIWGWMEATIQSALIRDPANSANIVSDDLSQSELDDIDNRARWTLRQPNWEDVLW